MLWNESLREVLTFIIVHIYALSMNHSGMFKVSSIARVPASCLIIYPFSSFPVVALKKKKCTFFNRHTPLTLHASQRFTVHNIGPACVHFTPGFPGIWKKRGGEEPLRICACPFRCQSEGWTTALPPPPRLLLDSFRRFQWLHATVSLPLLKPFRLKVFV